jgi:hypothetical protein
VSGPPQALSEMCGKARGGGGGFQLKSGARMNAGERKSVGGGGSTLEALEHEAGYESFFSTATGPGKPLKPFAYQIRLACGENARSDEPETFKRGCDCRSWLINVPTDLGKTPAIALAWLWNRVRLQNPKGGRCLIYRLRHGRLMGQAHKEVTWMN